MPAPDSDKLQARQVCLIGVGLIGGSLGLAMKKAGFAERGGGISRHTETLQKARARGCIDDATSDIGAALARSDLAVMCTPLSTFTDLFKQIAEHDHGGLTITDVGSTKELVCVQALRILGGVAEAAPL